MSNQLTKILVRVGVSRNIVLYRCIILDHRDVGLAGAALVVIVDGIAGRNVTLRDVVLRFVLVVGGHNELVDLRLGSLVMQYSIEVVNDK